MCRQRQNHSHTVLKISFRLVLGESDNLFVSRQVTFSRHYTTFVLGIHLSEFSFQILWTSERVKFFCKMAKFLLVGYFHFWAKPFSFWAKPFSFWAKRCGRNSLWAKLAITFGAILEKRLLGNSRNTSTLDTDGSRPN